MRCRVTRRFLVDACQNWPLVCDTHKSSRQRLSVRAGPAVNSGLDANQSLELALMREIVRSKGAITLHGR